MALSFPVEVRWGDGPTASRRGPAANRWLQYPGAVHEKGPTLGQSGPCCYLS